MPGSQGVGGGISIHSGEIKGYVERANGCESADLGLGLALPHGLVTFLLGLGFLTCEMTAIVESVMLASTLSWANSTPERTS